MEIVQLTVCYQKRKSIHEHAEPPAKRAKTQIKTVIREKSTKPKTSSKKSVKPRKESKPKKQRESASSAVPASERRRSSRAHKASDYKERDDAEDEEEMLEGVAAWDYGNDDSDSVESGSNDHSELSDNESGSELDEDDAAGDEEEEEEVPVAKRNGAKRPAAKASVKASVLAKVDRTARTSQRRRRSTKDEEMEMDED